MVDAKYRFIWASCGYPGNSPDIMQSTMLWQEIAQSKLLPEIAKNVGSVDVPPSIVGDSAFPFQTWPMKSYTNVVLTEKQTLQLLPKQSKDGDRWGIRSAQGVMAISKEIYVVRRMCEL